MQGERTKPFTWGSPQLYLGGFPEGGKVYEIEKDVSIPIHQSSKYPFAMMEIGDSFFVPIENLKTSKGYPEKTRDLASNIRTAASWWGKRHNNKYFSIRTIREDSSKYKVRGFRCWRIK